MVRAGNYLETAAAHAGIAKVTLFEWLRRGNREKSGVYREFVNDIEKALADAEIHDVLNIAKAGLEHWQAIAWRLERKFPARWGRKIQIGSIGSNPDQPYTWTPDRNEPKS
jgi:hypothetical protein